MPIQISLSNAIGALQGLAGGGPGPGPGPGYTPPLDSVTAAVAYSVRKMSSSYSGDCMLVRRVSDGATQAIGFDSNGLIDATALATFSAGSELTVKVWYDQAGGGFDLEQSNDAYLPTIYDGSAVTTSTSGKPCVRITRSASQGPGEWLQTNPVSLSTSGDMDVFLVLHGPLTGGGDRFFWNSQGGPTTSGARWGMGYGTNTYAQQPGPVTSTQIASVPVPDNLQFILNPQFNPSGNINTLVGNGIEFGTYTSSTTYRTDPYNVALGARVGGTEGYNAFDVSEVIHLPDFGVSNNESINLNINSYYQFTNLPYYSSGFLADYPNAAAAYSVRQLSNTAIKCMRVRRAVPPYDEQDIGFTAGGDLDEAAIVAFGGSDVLNVSAWYDQSGQSRHATQITPNSQPQIYDGAAVITENGKAALDFISNSSRSLNGPTFSNNSIMGFCVAREVVKRGTIWGLGGGLNYKTLELQYWDTELLLVFKGDGTNYDNVRSPTLTDDNAQHLVTLSRFSNALKTFVDGTADINTTDSYSANSGALGFATRNTQGQLLLQEAIFYETDQDAAGNRTGIETNINTYYKIIVNDEAATSGFLFDYPNAAAAYSVRQLNNNAEYAMQVERSDGRTKNIGFDGNGDLDTQAIIDFAGSSVATVRQWFDQTGNQNHAGLTQNPVIIYDGTSIISRSGIPVVQNGTNVGRMEFSPISIPASGGYTTFAAKGSQSNWGAVITGGWYPRSSSQGWIVSQGNTIANFFATNLFDEMVMTSRKDGNDYDMWRNTTSLYSNTLGTAYVGGPFEELFRGERGDPNSTVDDGLLHEAIFYDSALPDATVTNIQNNLITQYSL